MKTVLQVLTEARALISNPINWCQFSFHIRHGIGWHAHCAVGACRAVAGVLADDNVHYSNIHNIDIYNEAYKTAIAASCALQRQVGDEQVGDVSITGYNDNHTHQEVLDVFDGAIEDERKRLGRVTDISSLTALFDSRAPVAETV